MMQEKFLLKNGERLDDLQYHGLRIIQNPAGYCFSADSVLLSHYLRAGSRDRVLELCAGSGVIALLAAERTRAAFSCVEQDPDLCDMARRSMQLNQKEIAVWETDLTQAPALLGRACFDAVVCNPPYFHGGTQSPISKRSTARHDEGCSIESVANAAAALLKNGGRFTLCYPLDRLTDLLCALRFAKLEPKRMCFVAAKPSLAPYLVLAEAKKGAKPGLASEPVLYLKNEDGTDTDQIRRIYDGND